MINEREAVGEMRIGKENRSTRKTHPSTTLSTTNPTGFTWDRFKAKYEKIVHLHSTQTTDQATAKFIFNMMCMYGFRRSTLKMENHMVL
jgi:hypothetical protein